MATGGEIKARNSRRKSSGTEATMSWTPRPGQLSVEEIDLRLREYLEECRRPYGPYDRGAMASEHAEARQRALDQPFAKVE